MSVPSIYLIVSYFFPVATPTARESPLARGRFRAPAVSLQHSHSDVGCEPCLRRIVQLTATPDP